MFDRLHTSLLIGLCSLLTILTSHPCSCQGARTRDDSTLRSTRCRSQGGSRADRTRNAYLATRSRSLYKNYWVLQLWMHMVTTSGQMPIQKKGETPCGWQKTPYHEGYAGPAPATCLTPIGSCEILRFVRRPVRRLPSWVCRPWVPR